MLSVVIADDERGIIELIKNLIDPQIVEVEIVGEAENGVEAYNLIMEKRPDVVITDIRMPGMTGIELIEMVSKAGFMVTFVIISGYRNFTYAQNALKFGAVDYLLKPIKQSDLNNLLVRINEKKGSEIDKEIKVKTIQDQLAMSMDLLRKNTLWDLISGQPEKISNAISMIESKHVFHFETGKFCVAIVKIDSDSETDGVQYPNSSIETIVEKFVRKLRSDSFDADYVCRKTSGYIVFNYSNNLHLSIEQKQKYLYNLLKEDSYKYIFIHITIALGLEVHETRRICHSFKTAEEALHHRIDLECGIVLNYSSIAKEASVTDMNLADADRKKLVKCIENIDIADCMSTIQTLITKYLLNNEGKAFCLYGYCENLLRSIDEIIFHLIDEDISDREKYLEKIENSTTIVHLERVCREYASDILKIYASKKENQENRPIRLVKQYMQEHLGDQISLEDMARLVYLSPVYLSTLFKKETGMTFTNYLIEVRIEQTKKLLKTTSLGIAEIARMVGYKDVKHFSKLFIKLVGIKPVKFRKFYS